MSIDLSRPLVESMGQLDGLDGFVTFSRLQTTNDSIFGDGEIDLYPAITEMFQICKQTSWVTSDELGIGGLLIDAARLISLFVRGELVHTSIIERALSDAQSSLTRFDARRLLHSPTESRLAFRELGLTIGLRMSQLIRAHIGHHPDLIVNHPDLISILDAILEHSKLVEHIEDFWLAAENQFAKTWTRNIDNNAVMLATSLLAADPRFIQINDGVDECSSLDHSHKEARS